MTLSSTLFCDTCGAANRAQAAFCCACGRPLQHTFQGATQQTLTGLLVQQHVLKQRYRILGQLGKGGFGAVYKAADSQFGQRLLAIKEMSQSNLNARELVEATQSFQREALLLANLTHPNLPRIYEQFHEAGRCYLVMDYIEGETLETYLDRLGGKLPVEKVLNIGLQLCSVLDYLHMRQPPIIFRDLKPANVMVMPDGHIFLIDFGIARHFKPGQSKDTTALGSSGYAAPEQYGKMQTTPRTDIYTLGATLHQMLSGDDPADAPFHFAPLQLHGSPALAELAGLIMQMLEVDISKRPASVAEVRRRLQDIANQHTAATTHPLQATLPPGYQTSTTGQTLSRASIPGATLPPQNISSPVARNKQAHLPQAQKNTLFICTGHSSRITAVAWSLDGSQLASTSYDKTVRVWDARSGTAKIIYRGHSDRVNALTWSPDNSRVASASDDGTIQVWQAATGTTLFSYGSHSGKVLAVAWSPDGSRIVSADSNKGVQVWDVNIRRSLFTYRGHTQPVTALAWSPDSKRIVSGSVDTSVHSWEPTKDTKTNFFIALFNTSNRSVIYRGHTQRITSVAWSPDGRRIASTSSDKTMQVWDAASGKLGFIYRNPSFSMNSVTWSPDSRYLCAGSNDKIVRVWDAITRNIVHLYHGHTSYVTSVAWSPERGSQCIASASVDHTVQLWKPV